MAATRPVRTWDLVTTIVLLVVMLGAAALAFFLSFLLAFAGDSCGASAVCDYDVISTGFVIAMFGPPVVAAVALIAGIVLLVLRVLAFWVPIVGIVLIAGVFLVGAAITASGVVVT